MNYSSLLAQYKALLVGKWLTDFANTSAFIMSEIPRLNWVGFYLLEDNKLWLGPFQGKPACTEILLGRGVCGKSAEKREPIVVDDVHLFDDHIVCDAASQSEMVVPLISENGKLIGVLDVDSPEKSRFDLPLQKFLIDVAKILMEGHRAHP